MKNNKLLLVLTLGLLTAIVLAGCGTQSTPEAAAPQAPQQTDPEPVSPQQDDSTTEVQTIAETEAPTEAVPVEQATEAPADSSAATVSFANDVMPIIDSRCVNCHGGQRTEEGLVMRSYEDIMAGSDNGAVVIPGDIANSLFVELVTNQKMPKKGPKLTPPQIQIFTDWVAAGAPNN